MSYPVQRLKVAKSIAWRRCREFNALSELSDMVQEAVIAAWKVATPDTSEAFLRKVMDRRILACLTTGTRLGSEKVHWDRHKKPEAHFVPLTDTFTVQDFPLFDYSEQFAEPDRTIVAGLSVGDTQEEIASDLRVTSRAIRWRITNRIAPVLKGQLC